MAIFSRGKCPPGDEQSGILEPTPLPIVHKTGGGFVILDTPLIIGIEVNGAQSKPKRRSQEK